jgi:hypothetical protein
MVLVEPSPVLYPLKYVQLNPDTVSNCAAEASVVSEQSLFMIITFQEGKQV